MRNGLTSSVPDRVHTEDIQTLDLGFMNESNFYT